MEANTEIIKGNQERYFVFVFVFIGLDQYFSTRVILPPGNIWPCGETLWVFTARERGGVLLATGG